MPTLKVLLGSLLFVIGIIFFYKPHLFLKVNFLAREYLFNDRFAIIIHKKIAMTLIAVSVIVLYMGISSMNYKTSKTADDPLTKSQFAAIKSFYRGDYPNSLRQTYQILAKKPDDEWALVHLCCMYTVMNEEKKAAIIWEKVAELYPDNRVVKIIRKRAMMTDEKKK